jgi:hypothetical protein
MSFFIGLILQLYGRVAVFGLFTVAAQEIGNRPDFCHADDIADKPFTHNKKAMAALLFRRWDELREECEGKTKGAFLNL